jgi:hypothetical protein
LELFGRGPSFPEIGGRCPSGENAATLRQFHRKSLSALLIDELNS